MNRVCKQSLIVKKEGDHAHVFSRILNCFNTSELSPLDIISNLKTVCVVMKFQRIKKAIFYVC